MKLLPKYIRAKLPALGSQESKGYNTVLYVKYFTPWSSWTWYVAEYDGKNTFYGMVDGFEREFGYFNLIRA